MRKDEPAPFWISILRFVIFSLITTTAVYAISGMEIGNSGVVFATVGMIFELWKWDDFDLRLKQRSKKLNSGNPEDEIVYSRDSGLPLFLQDSLIGLLPTILLFSLGIASVFWDIPYVLPGADGVLDYITLLVVGAWNFIALVSSVLFHFFYNRRE